MDKAQREQLAAEKLFSLLPEDQNIEFRDLWDEFEEMSTPESQFANSMDSFLVIFQNFKNRGGTWKVHDIPKSKVIDRQRPVKQGDPALWEKVEEVLDRSCSKGFLRKD